jgi:hypothetical protein
MAALYYQTSDTDVAGSLTNIYMTTAVVAVIVFLIASITLGDKNYKSGWEDKD